MLTYFIIGQAWLINVVVPNTSVKPMKKQKVLGIPHYTKFFCFRTKVTYMHSPISKATLLFHDYTTKSLSNYLKKLTIPE